MFAQLRPLPGDQLVKGNMRVDIVNLTIVRGNWEINREEAALLERNLALPCNQNNNNNNNNTNNKNNLR